jgi:hypothetical protein
MDIAQEESSVCTVFVRQLWKGYWAKSDKCLRSAYTNARSTVEQLSQETAVPSGKPNFCLQMLLFC